VTAPLRKKRPRKPGEALSLERVMAELERAGTAQNRKVYRRHGAGDPLFGVSFSQINKLRKRLGLDHALGKALFETGNSDAITLGLMIMDPEALEEGEADRMLEGLSYYMLTDLLVTELVIYRREREVLMETWTASDSEYTARAGYCILNQLAKLEDGLTDDVFRAYLDRIAAEIHRAPNRARQMMNLCVLSIGARPGLHADALAAARRIGPVAVDHGETSCETFDAVARLSDPDALAKARRKLKWLTSPTG